MDRVKNKILTAVYGGSFNPFGNHHQEVIRSLVACGYQVIVVPAVAHALKPNLLSYHHRYNMAKISVEDLLTQMVSNGWSKDVKVKLSNAEVDLLRKQKPPIRTYELLQEIRQNIGPQHTLKFAIGPDIHDEIHKWKNVSHCSKTVLRKLFSITVSQHTQPLRRACPRWRRTAAVSPPPRPR